MKMKPMNKKEWKEFQERVKKGSLYKKTIGVDFYSITIKIKLKKLKKIEV